MVSSAHAYKAVSRSTHLQSRQHLWRRRLARLLRRTQLAQVRHLANPWMTSNEVRFVIICPRRDLLLAQVYQLCVSPWTVLPALITLQAR